ncbi:glycoside hydrolase family 13 protein [Coprobacter tertius]|uniref:Alpha-glucosidase n=1 Tax=Coprobacter tertius TaxID=2944915 RepID=A0ABT1ML60_9BACT|nr:alpha-glucosidase [Coprobacter tertius]MCP9612789.1 alpha-glucosidase [Coprobacter tertius]
MVKNKNWWKEAIVYQVYPRSFKDSNGDGIGDLKGITQKLDYIKSLGVDIIWLNPVFESPNDDNGYDISNYFDIMSDFGTMADFDELLLEIHEREMKLVLDLVVNHTSDEHHWFKEARKSRENPYYDYYLWWPAERGVPPERKSYFDEKGNAWMYNETTDSYYLHYFSRKQPDLNWENDDMREEIYTMMKFWFDKGIDGFRMDSISLISKDNTFPVIDRRKFHDIFDYYAKGPSLHRHLHEMNRKVLSLYDVMSVGEGSAVKVKDIGNFVEPARQELDMLYLFEASQIRNECKADSPESGIEYSLITLKKMFAECDKAVGEGWPTIYLGNHDQPRMVTRFGNDAPEFHALSSKMLTTFLLTMRGTPYWYAGDEIGMSNIKFDHIEDYNDIDTRNHYYGIKSTGGDTAKYLELQKQIARDNARTPFQWDASEKAGFTTGKPWLKINKNHLSLNVESEEKDKNSILSYFKKMVLFRKAHKCLIYGDFRLVDTKNERVFGYTRISENEKYLIALNFSKLPATFYADIYLNNAEVQLFNYETAPDVKGKEIGLRPYEAAIWKI